MVLSYFLQQNISTSYTTFICLHIFLYIELYIQDVPEVLHQTDHYFLICFGFGLIMGNN